MAEEHTDSTQKDFGCCRGQLFDDGYEWHQFTCVNWSVHYWADRMHRSLDALNGLARG